MVDLLCKTCGKREVYLQLNLWDEYRPLLVCGNCGEHEAVLWRKGERYLPPFSHFSAESTESTGPTTNTYSV